MEQRKIRSLSNNAKIIKITGQNTGPLDGVDCEYDCHIVEKEWVGRTYTNMIPCYIDHYIITADYYNAHWTSSF
jgi:hypothetical protein